MILVTGATGNVGAALVKEPEALKVPFRAAVRHAGNLGMQSVAFDFDNSRSTNSPAISRPPSRRSKCHERRPSEGRPRGHTERGRVRRLSEDRRGLVHLRLCVSCGHVGCCDSSPNRHATKHFQATKHPIVQSFEPGEDWRWCYVDEAEV